MNDLFFDLKQGLTLMAAHLPKASIFSGQANDMCYAVDHLGNKLHLFTRPEYKWYTNVN